MTDKSSKNVDNRGLIDGLKLFSGSSSQLLTQIKEQINHSKDYGANTSNLLTIATPNPEIVVQSIADSNLRADLDEFSLRIPDGVGLVHAAQLLQTRPAKIRVLPGVEVVSEILLLPELDSGSVFLVGGREYGQATFDHWMVQDVNIQSKSSSPDTEGKKTLLWHYGFLESADPTIEESNSIRHAVEAARPTVVFVALGAPQQERWVVSNQDWLEKAGVRVVMVVGGAFDMLFGRIPRAPGWVRSAGLEWLFRLYQEPWRWRRQLRLVSFLTIVGKEWLSSRFAAKK